jgi:tetratricopeptide (TPR) repeat protein
MATLRSSLIDIGEPLAASPRRALASVLWNRTRLRLRGLRYRARRESQVPVETLRRLDALRAVAHGLAMVDNIRGADFNGRLLLLALRTGEVRRLVGAIATEVVFLVSQGAIGRGRRLFDELVELAEACPDQAYGRTWVLLADGAASFFEGRFTRAVAALGQAEDVFADGPTGLTFERNNVRVFRVHALRLLGALREQDALITELVRGGRQRGDRYLETTLRLLQGQALLARDDLAEARRSIEDATWTSPEHGFHLQHWYELRARVELALYTGTAPAAAAALVGQFAALDRSMLLRVRIVQHDAIWLRARLALAAGGGDGPVHAAARQLARAGVGYATVYALLLRAGLSARAPGPAMACLRQAIELAETHDMALHLAAARDRLGRLVGGAEGAALRAAAARYAAEQRIVAPDRMFEIVAPGLLHE